VGNSGVEVREVKCFNVITQYLHCIVEVRFIGGGNRSTLRKPPTCRKSLTIFITSHNVHLAMSGI